MKISRRHAGLAGSLLGLLCIGLIGGCNAVQPGASMSGWSFAAFGDTPYSPTEDQALERMIAQLNREPLPFVLHVGDFKGGVEPCSDALLKERVAQLNRIRHAVIFVPGDNEWTDCHRAAAGGYDPLERLAFLRAITAAGDRSLGGAPIALQRQPDSQPQHAAYREHVRFEHQGVIFVGLNVTGSNNNLGRTAAMDAEYRQRMAAVGDWVEASTTLAMAEPVQALVLFFQADINIDGRYPPRPNKPDGYAEFRALLARTAQRLNKPLLLVHGDSHDYYFDQPLRDAKGVVVPQLTRLEVPGSPRTEWVKVRAGAGKDANNFWQATPFRAPD